MGTDIYGSVDVKKSGKWEQIADLCKMPRDLRIWPILTKDWVKGKGLPPDFKKRIPIRAAIIGGGDYRGHTWLTYKEIRKMLTDVLAIDNLSEEWVVLFEKMKREAAKYGDANVRIVMWFDA